MRPWNERTREEAFLFNPGFLSLVMWSTGTGFHEITGTGLPFQLAFLAAPVTLHKPTRDALPRSINTSLAAWLEENPFLRAGLADRARALSPFVREALLFGIARALFRIDGAEIAPASRPKGMTRYLKGSTDEVSECLRKAVWVGRWFGAAGTPPTVMALWGVKP